MSEESKAKRVENPLFEVHQRRMAEITIPELEGPQFAKARKLIVDTLERNKRSETASSAGPAYINIRTVFDHYAEKLGLPVEELLKMDREEHLKFLELLDQHGLRMTVKPEDL